MCGILRLLSRLVSLNIDFADAYKWFGTNLNCRKVDIHIAATWPTEKCIYYITNIYRAQCLVHSDEYSIMHLYSTTDQQENGHVKSSMHVMLNHLRLQSRASDSCGIQEQRRNQLATVVWCRIRIQHKTFLMMS